MLVVNLCMFVQDFLFVKHLDTLVGILNVWLNCKDRWLYIFGLLDYNLHWFCKVVIFALSVAHTVLLMLTLFQCWSAVDKPTNLILLNKQILMLAQHWPDVVHPPMY